MLEKLAPHSRIWIYQATRLLTPAEEKAVSDSMRQFIPGWASHGNEIYGDFVLADSLFLIVGADEQKSPTSGCSIDSLNRHIKKLGEELNIEFFDRLRVAYVNRAGKIEILPLHEFKALLKKDTVTASTMVFNNLIETRADLETKWKIPVKLSWHKNLLDIG